MKQMIRNNLAERLHNKPLLVLPASWHSIQAKAEQSPNIIQDMDGDDDGDQIDITDYLPKMEIENGVAVIPVCGFISNNVHPLLQFYFGMCDVRDIKNNLEMAIADNNVNGICLYFDSPGGEAGIEPVAQMIADCPKPIAAFGHDYMASAAYYLAAGADEIYAHPLATGIGYIGTYWAHWDYSQAYAQNGIKLDVIAKGKFKGEGNYSTALSPEFKQYMETEMTRVNNQFWSFIEKNRPQISKEDRETTLALDTEQALAKGYIDGTAEDISDIFVK